VSSSSGRLLKPLLWVADYSGAVPLNKRLEKRLEKWDFLTASREKTLAQSVTLLESGQPPDCGDGRTLGNFD
jgi:hypothetical protein